MKILKLFATTVLLVVLSAGMSVAQGNKMVTTTTASFQFLMPCTADFVTGVETIIQTIWDGKVQLRGKGTFTGESGKFYTWSLAANFSFKNFKEGSADNTTEVVTSVIECEGIPVGFYKIRAHLTINANGEPAVEFERETDDYICL